MKIWVYYVVINLSRPGETATMICEARTEEPITKISQLREIVEDAKAANNYRGEGEVVFYSLLREELV